MSKTVHPIAPIYDENSKILILGSFPSVKSREEGFFYGHRQNRFWKVVSVVLEQDEPKSIDEKRAFLLKNGIAVWDVIAECEILGSADSSISNAKANDIMPILTNSDIKAIFTNGKKAFSLFESKIQPNVLRKSIYLPSTSPANAMFSFEKLVEEWKIIKEFLK